MAAWWLSLVKPISDIFTKTLDKIAVDKTKKVELEFAFKTAIEQFFHETGMAFEKRVLAEIENPNWFRDAVRPIITYCAWALYMTVKVVTVYYVTKIYMPMMKAAETASESLELLAGYREAIFNEWDVWILICIIGFWFGPKAVERLYRTGKQAIDTKTGGIIGKVKGWLGGKGGGGGEDI